MIIVGCDKAWLRVARRGLAEGGGREGGRPQEAEGRGLLRRQDPQEPTRKNTQKKIERPVDVIQEIGPWNEIKPYIHHGQGT